MTSELTLMMYKEGKIEIGVKRILLSAERERLLILCPVKSKQFNE
jgi:hypothetical protein